jgi:hypothetical protein
MCLTVPVMVIVTRVGIDQLRDEPTKDRLGRILRGVWVKIHCPTPFERGQAPDRGRAEHHVELERLQQPSPRHVR